MQLGPRQIDLNRGQIRDGTSVGRLTTRELALLRYLVEHSGEVVTREQMLTDVWGYSKTTDTRTVYATLHNLRKKIEADSKNPQWLTTAHGAGYKFHLPDTPNVAAPPPPYPRAPGQHCLGPLHLDTTERRDTLVDDCGRHARVGYCRCCRWEKVVSCTIDTWDGAFRWCSLEEVHSTTDCVLQLGQMLGLTLAGTDADGQAAILDTLANMGPLLLGLDGLDSVDPDFITRLESWMLHLPDIRWIWTSQQAIDCQMQQIVVVQGVQGATGRTFLLERAAAAGAVGVDRTDPFLDKIVSAVDGNPLVLSLIAPRLRSTSAETLWARLPKIPYTMPTNRPFTNLPANSLNANWTRPTGKNTLMVSAQLLKVVHSLARLCSNTIRNASWRSL